MIPSNTQSPRPMALTSLSPTASIYIKEVNSCTSRCRGNFERKEVDLYDILTCDARSGDPLHDDLHCVRWALIRKKRHVVTTCHAHHHDHNEKEGTRGNHLQGTSFQRSKEGQRSGQRKRKVLGTDFNE